MTKNKTGTKAKTKAAYKDPVCGMVVKTDRAIKEVSGGKTYYFCGETCRKTFISKSGKNDSNDNEHTAGSSNKNAGDKYSSGCCT